MNLKQILRIVLALFLLTSVGFLVAKGQKDASPASSQAADTTADQAVTAYYFHGNTRCQTCRAIESYTKQALEEEFPQELADGRLQIEIINLDQAENEHFVDDFQLTSRAVVLARTDAAGEQVWKGLPQVWDWVHEGESAFAKSLDAETKTFLEAAAR